MSRPRAAWTGLAATALLTAGADQLIKAVIVSRLEIGETDRVFDWLDLAHIRNDGVAFGLFGGSGAGVVVVSLIAVGLMLAWFTRNPRRPGAWLAIGALAGGAIGNLADRVFRGSVVDYLDLSFWPAFNLADVAIIGGVAALVLIATAQDPAGHG